MCVIYSHVGLEWDLWIRDVPGLVNGSQRLGPRSAGPSDRVWRKVINDSEAEFEWTLIWGSPELCF